MRLTDLFIRLVEQLCAAHELILVSPRDGAARGSQVSFRHPQGYPVMQALISHGVIGDFRDPDILRFGLTPLYTSHEDLVRAGEILAAILADASHLSPQFSKRYAVT